LTDVVITNPIQANLVSWVTFSCGVAAAMTVQMKDFIATITQQKKFFLLP
jgi:hypothetical protein